MLVNLTKKFSGRKIIETFKESVSFESSSDMKWMAKEANTLYSWGAMGIGVINKLLEPLEDLLYKAWTKKKPPKSGVSLFRSWKTKNGRWIEDFSTTIELLSLRPEDYYEEVEIVIRVRASDLDEDRWCECVNIDHKSFPECKATFDNFLNKFARKLGVKRLSYT